MVEKRFCYGYKEAAEYSGFTARQLKRMVSRGEIGALKYSKTRIVFKKVELDQYREKFWVKKG